MISERISIDIPPEINIFNMVILILMHSAVLSQIERCARHPTKCDVINDVKLFPTVYRRIYYRIFLVLSNQKLRYKSKCITIYFAVAKMKLQIKLSNLSLFAI